MTDDRAKFELCIMKGLNFLLVENDCKAALKYFQLAKNQNIDDKRIETIMIAWNHICKNKDETSEEKK